MWYHFRVLSVWPLYVIADGITKYLKLWFWTVHVVCCVVLISYVHWSCVETLFFIPSQLSSYPDTFILFHWWSAWALYFINRTICQWANNYDISKYNFKHQCMKMSKFHVLTRSCIFYFSFKIFTEFDHLELKCYCTTV